MSNTMYFLKISVRLWLITAVPLILLIRSMTNSQSSLNIITQRYFKEPSFSLAPKAQEPEKVLHFLWGHPSADERGYAGKERVFDNSSFTGCCDTMAELAIRSYAHHLPNHALWLWNMGGWDAEGFIQHIGMQDRVQIKVFDPVNEFPDDSVLQGVFHTVHRMVPRSDFVRYTVLRNYGGSYIDLDGVMVRPPFDDLPRINVSPTPSKEPHVQTCANVTYVNRAPGTCILSNGAFINFPRNHVVFSILLNTIRKENRTCGGTQYFCFGPTWQSKVLRENGISNVEQVGVKPTVLLRNKGAYKKQETVIVSHWDFDVGDIDCGRPIVSDFCAFYGMAASNDTSSNRTSLSEAVNRVPKKALSAARKHHNYTVAGYTNRRMDSFLKKSELATKEENQPILFVHIPKTAGTTIERIFGMRASCHGTASDMRNYKPAEYDKALSFTAIRYPVDRIVSLYNYARNGGNGSKGDVRKFGWVRQVNFSSFVDALPSQRSVFYAPQKHFVVDHSNDSVILIKEFICTENLEAGWERLSNMSPILKSYGKFPTKRQRVSILSNNTFSAEEVDPLTIVKLKRMYHDDFELWEKHCGEYSKGK